MPQRNSRKAPEGIPCGYCFSNWATSWDHLVPFSYRDDQSWENLYPSCKRCNCILGSKMFNTIAEKREYVRTRLMQMGVWNVPSVSSEIPEEETTSEILHNEVPVDVLGCDSSPRCVECGAEMRYGKMQFLKQYCSTQCKRKVNNRTQREKAKANAVSV